MSNLVTESLARFLARLDYRKLPENVIMTAKLCTLDLIGSIVSGSNKKPAKILVEIVRRFHGLQESTIMMHGFKGTRLNASLANGVMSHIVEMDDFHRFSMVHPGAPIIPAALAIAEAENASGKSLLLSIVAGYEAAIRIGEAVGRSHYKFWHSTATCGIFGAAVAAGKILEFNEEEMLNAIGNAGTQASGLWQFIKDGAMSKHLHAGKAAHDGVLSALLAGEGFTGARRILEGEVGFLRATSSNYDIYKLTERLGEKFKILEVSFKPHASCRHTHSAIDAILKLKQKYDLKVNNVKKINVKTYSEALSIAGKIDPKTSYEAKFSLPYCIAIALIKGKVGLSEFNLKLLGMKDVRSLMKKTQISVDPEIDLHYPDRLSALIEVETVDGRLLEAMVENPLGDPENPMSEKMLSEKFLDLTIPVLGSSKARTVIRNILDLDKASSINDLMEILR